MVKSRGGMCYVIYRLNDVNDTESPNAGEMKLRRPSGVLR